MFLAGAMIEIAVIIDTAPREQLTPASTFAPEYITPTPTSTPEIADTPPPDQAESNFGPNNEAELVEPTAPEPTSTPAPVAVSAAAYSEPRSLPASDPGNPRVEAVLAVCGLDTPLGPYAQVMIDAAAAAGIDWRLLPVIALKESSCGAAACGGNAWGWGNCSGIIFTDFDTAIGTVSAGLSRRPYAGRSLDELLCIYVLGDPSCSSPHARDYRDDAIRRMDGMNQ